jgi:alkylhydroperoxidase family enzyme
MTDQKRPDVRIERLPVDDARARAEDVGLPAMLADLSVFRIALTNPVIAKGVSDLLLALLTNGRLDPRLRELIIMRIGWVSGAEYEWTQHWRVARRLPMEPDDILGVRDWESHHGYGDVERAVLRATDETLRDGFISDATWNELRGVITDDGTLFELVIAIGNWQMFANLLRSLQVPLEDGVDPWPPDGLQPPSSRGR